MVAECRDAAHRSFVTVTNETGGTSTTMHYYGLDKYQDLFRDKTLTTDERLLVAESAEANLAFLSSHRAEMEVFLAFFYCEDATRNDEKAARYAGLALTTAGAMSDMLDRHLAEIRFLRLYRSQRYYEADDFLESVIRNEPPTNKDNQEWQATLEQWRNWMKEAPLRRRKGDNNQRP